MRRLRCGLILAMLVLGIRDTEASYLSSADWKTGGDGLLTYDSNTGNYWLDLTQTQGMSYNSVVASLAPGGLYEGFRVATYAEARQLFADGDIPDLFNSSPPSAVEVSRIQSILDLIGRTATYSASHPNYQTLEEYSFGMVSPVDFTPALLPANSVGGLVVRHYLYDDIAFPMFSSHSAQLLDFMNQPMADGYRQVATFLIRDVQAAHPTPEPTSLALAGFAGVGMALGVWRKRRQQRRCMLSQTAA